MYSTNSTGHITSTIISFVSQEDPIMLTHFLFIKLSPIRPPVPAHTKPIQHSLSKLYNSHTAH